MRGGMKNIKIVFLLIFTPIIYGMDNSYNNSVYKEISKEIINSCLKNKIESLPDFRYGTPRLFSDNLIE